PREFVGRRGERHARHVGETFGKYGEADIFGPEVVPPLRYAMRFVDGEQRDLALREQAKAARRDQPLWRDIEQIEITGDEAALDRGCLFERQRGIQCRRIDACLD